VDANPSSGAEAAHAASMRSGCWRWSQAANIPPYEPPTATTDGELYRSFKACEFCASKRDGKMISKRDGKLISKRDGKMISKRGYERAFIPCVQVPMPQSAFTVVHTVGVHCLGI
jgi:hypothetical protein